MIYKCFATVLFVYLVGCPKGLCVEEDRDGILAKIRAESALKIKSFKFKDVKYDNGITCVLKIEYDSIEGSNAHEAKGSFVVKPRVSFDKWKQGLDPSSPLFKEYFNGWAVGFNLRDKFRFDVYRKFNRNGTEILLPVPDNMSYLEVGLVLDFLKKNDVAIEKSYQIEKKNGVVEFKTLDVFVNPLNAKGEFFEVELDEKGIPAKIARRGRWIS